MTKSRFDRNEVIDKAIELFWKNGFTASSMQQVVKTTGLKPGSIYLAFGNKEGLFREALESYAKKSIAYIRNLLDTAPSIGDGICALFEAFIKDSTRNNYNSCFLIKTRLELAAERGELHDYASAKLDEVEALFKSYLEREYDNNISQQRAASIMLHIFGIRVYGYQQDSADRMRKELREGLPWLPWPA
ncbi:TetR/AcrR family transcriptional regulator [Trichlorobacter lovleyi]|uniref:TetR/AcrR family transcriptional regulator n=1 Tax=Trichlorobacter lovleyi TaxID=313985 RepID=UPI003D0AFA77